MRLLTKIQVVLAAAFIISISLSSVFAVTRTISDTSDTVDTYIRNSNGKYWEATGANLQTAINDLGGLPGTVWLPGLTTITTASTITLGEYTTLDMQGCTIQASADVDVISMASSAIIKGGCIDVSQVDGYSHACILFDGSKTIGNSWYNGPPFGHTGVYMMWLKGKQVVGQHPHFLNGTGILMKCDSKVASEYIMGVSCEHVDMEDLEMGIYLDCSGGSNTPDMENYINSNYFSHIWMNDVQFCIKLDRNQTLGVTKSSIWGNKFYNIIDEMWVNADWILRAEGDYNEFDITAWDHGNSNYTGNDFYNLSKYCNNTILRFMGAAGDYKDYGLGNTIIDLGYDNGVGKPCGNYAFGAPLRLIPQNASYQAREGDLRVGTDNHIYCYLNSGWKQLD